MSQIKVDNIQHTLNSNDAISLASDSSVSLKHSGNSKLVTSSSGVSVTGTCTATAFSGDGANLTNVPAPSTFNAANLTGTLPAIDGSNLTGIASNQPAWFGKLAANQTGISNVTWTTITNLTDASVNPSSNSGGWDSSTGVYTVQSGQAGIYYAFGGFKLDDLQSYDVISAGISKNDATPSPTSYNRQDYASHHFQYTSMAQIFSLAVGDTLRFKVYHNEGTTENAVADETHFGGFRIFAT